MGNLKSKHRKTKTDAISITNSLREEQKQNKRKHEYNTVLLGTGQSGKSTIFHQFQKACMQQNFTDMWPNEQSTIRQNILYTVRTILKVLGRTYDDDNVNLDWLIKDIDKNELFIYAASDRQNSDAASDRQNIDWEIRSLVRDLEADQNGEPLPSHLTHTQQQMRQKLSDIVEKRMPRLKEIMKATFSKMFDLENLSDCLKLLITAGAENFRRFDKQNITINSWDNTLDNTIIDMQTATAHEISSYSDTIFNMIGGCYTDRCLDNMDSYGKALHKVWNELKQFRFVFYNLGAKYDVNYIDNMDYYFNKCLLIFYKDYIPNEDDLVRMYVRTTGIIEQRFTGIGNECIGSIRMLDTGGQRNERKKWIGCFSSDTHAIVYVVGLDHFRQSLFEDEHTNAMKECIDCFENVLANNRLSRCSIILVLNKIDLFKQSLKEGHKLSLCFGDEYKGMNYDKVYETKIINILISNMIHYNTELKIPVEIIHIVSKFLDCELSLKFAYNDGIEFIKQKFISVNSNENRQIQVIMVNAMVQNDMKRLLLQIYDNCEKTYLENCDLIV